MRFKRKKISIFIIVTFVFLGLFFIPNKQYRSIVNKIIYYSDPKEEENSIEVSGIKNGMFSVTIKNVSKNVSNVQVPVWSSVNGQDDTIWYTAKKQGNGNFKADVYLKDHKYDNGLYNIHVYLNNSNNQMVAFNGTTTNVNVNKGDLSFVNVNNKNEQMSISLTNTDYYQDKIQFAVWSDVAGQDDIHWYTASKSGDAAVYNVQLKNHKNFGNYLVHVYSFDSRGNGTLVTTGVFKIEEPKVLDSSYNFDPTTNNIDIEVKFDPSANINKVQIPTWSVPNGQDDIHWYDAINQGGGVWKVHTNLSNHYFSVGQYLSHVYVGTSTGMYSHIYSLTKEIIPTNRFSVSVSDDESSFTINYSDYAKLKGYTLHYAVWSAANGQDDIKWYTAKNGSYTGIFGDHLNKNGTVDTGTYLVHFYVSKNGNYYFLDSSSFTVTNPKVNTLELVQTGGKLDIYVKNVSSSVTSVQIPFWSNNKGQDDIIWYKAYNQGGGVWKASVNLKNHKYDQGNYTAHAYIKRGNNLLVIGKVFNITLNKGNLTFENDGFDNKVKINLVDSDFVNENIRFAVWSAANGQDDIKWYTASKSNGTATYTVPIKNHKTAGKYYVHAYYGNTMLIDSDFTIDDILFNAEILNVDKNDVNGDGVYQVKVSGINSKSGVSLVQVPVWSVSNQSDIYWYKAVKQGDDYIVNVNPRNHKFNNGKYHTHVYVTANNGITKFIVKEDTDIDLQIGAKVVSQRKGSNQINVYNTSPKVSKVQVPTWSNGLNSGESNSQDDIIWYDAVKQGDGSWTANIKSSDHSPFGLTTSHVYATAGKDTLFTALSYNIEKYMLTPIYYSQKDPEWKDYVFGNRTIEKTGCMPSSIAMAASGILDRRITPLEVAHYLYFGTSEYNKFFYGSSGMTVKLASQRYGLSYKSLKSLNQVENSLKNGQIVIAAVAYGPDRFVASPLYTHAIVLFGYNGDGTTNVYDPNNSGKNGRYSIAGIYNQQSRVPEDLSAGSAFHALY